MVLKLAKVMAPIWDDLDIMSNNNICSGNLSFTVMWDIDQKFHLRKTHKIFKTTTKRPTTTTTAPTTTTPTTTTTTISTTPEPKIYNFAHIYIYRAFFTHPNGDWGIYVKVYVDGRFMGRTPKNSQIGVQRGIIYLIETQMIVVLFRVSLKILG